MKYIKQVFTGFALITLVSCSEQEKYSNLVFNNDIDCNAAWNYSPLLNVIKFENAHSGSYVVKIDGASAYSTTFNMKLADISKEKISKVKISAWVLMPDFNSSPDLVAEIRTATNEVKDWISVKASDFVEEESKWTLVENEIDLGQNDRNNLENSIRIYVSNGKEAPAYVDDLRVEFVK